MSFLSNNVIRKSLEEGVAYPSVLVTCTEREAEKNDEGILGYVVFGWQLEDGRIVTDSCRVTDDGASFPSGLKIRLTELADQLPKTSKLLNDSADKFIASIIASKHKFNLWIDHNDTGDRFYTNYHFREPRVKAIANATVAPRASLVAPTKDTTLETLKVGSINGVPTK